MDGFRERLSGRYDRSERGSMRSDRYDRPSEDRYDRSPRRDNGVGIDAIAAAIDKSNKDQLEVIMDLFDEAKADRLDSERAIIDAMPKTVVSEPAVSEPEADKVETPVDDTLARIERMTSQNAESLSESGEMLERSVNTLRSNAELLNDIKSNVASLCEAQSDMKASSFEMQQSIQQSIYAMSQQVQAPSGAGSDEMLESVMSAVGDNRALLNMIRQDIINSMSKPAVDDNEETESSPYLTADAADKYYKDLEEHVHKECVKCYRNVQSALTEQNEAAALKTTKSLGGIRTVVGISLALNVMTLVVLVLRILEIL